MSIKVTNLEELRKQLKKFGSEGKKVVIDELDIAGTNIERAAINAAPAFLGGAEIVSTFKNKKGKSVTLNLKQRIDKVVSKGGLNVKVGVQGQQDLDAYIEFGTGLNFFEVIGKRPQDYTPEILALARTFKKKRLGTLRGTPYLFPSFFDESPKLIQRLRNKIETLAAKS